MGPGHTLYLVLDCSCLDRGHNILSLEQSSAIMINCSGNVDDLGTFFLKGLVNFL
jgi:hypothetical protein